MEMEVKLTGILSVGNLGPEDMGPGRDGHRPYGTTLHVDRAKVWLVGWLLCTGCLVGLLGRFAW